jgi:hypothetical protein
MAGPAAGSQRSSTPMEVMSSTWFNTVIGVVGLAIPLIAFILQTGLAKDIALVVAAIVIVGLVVRAQRLRMAVLPARRAVSREMADPRFFERVANVVRQRFVDHINELADGYLNMYSSEVPPISLLLYRTLAETPADGHVRAVDLTTDPAVLLTRLEYLAANRYLIQSGGSVQRVFICGASDLLRAEFASGLMRVVDEHRDAGVECGLAVRERVRPDELVDAVIFGRAAVLVEHAQADVEYTSGWSAIYFKRIDAWVTRFDRLWRRNETAGAPAQLAAYEAACRPMLMSGAWDQPPIRTALDLRPKAA